MRTLVAIPVYNEQRYLKGVLERVLDIHPPGADRAVLVIDDGSTDRTPHDLPEFPVEVVRHAANRGYGASMSDAFGFARAHRFDWLVTMDCDEQHEPDAIPAFLEQAERDDADVISGTRYLRPLPADQRPPEDRRAINRAITTEINARLASGLGAIITDAFCGFKAYRVRSLRPLRLTVRGYEFPMQFWVQAAAEGLRVQELPVRLIYNDPNRTFGARLDDPAVRLAHYRAVLHREVLRHAARLPATAVAGLMDEPLFDACEA